MSDLFWHYLSDTLVVIVLTATDSCQLGPKRMHRITRSLLTSLLVTALLGACSLPPISIWHRESGSYEPDRESGLASWYGPGFHGRPTASGEIYNQYAMTAAHRTLPLGTKVRVTHIGSGRSVDVRINDRGPFVKGRVIDLSFKAAQRLRIISAGTAKVTLQRIDGGTLVPVRYAAQVAAFRDSARADSLRRKLTGQFGGVYISPHKQLDTETYRVRIGPFLTRNEAQKQARKLARVGMRALVVEESIP